MKSIKFNEALLFSHCEWSTPNGKVTMLDINFFTRNGSPQVLWGGVNSPDRGFSTDLGSTFKPILRDIKSLTNDELIEIAMIAYGDDSTYYKFCVNVNISFENDNMRQAFFRDSEDLLHKINLWGDFSISVDCETFFPEYYNVFMYLISKGFDVFNWIEKGLAVLKK